MPRFSLCKKALKQLDTFILLYCSTRADQDDTSFIPTSSFLNLLFTALTSISTCDLDLDDDDESGGNGLQESVIMMDMMMMTLSNMNDQSQILFHKRKQEKDDITLSKLLLVQDQAYKSRYI